MRVLKNCSLFIHEMFRPSNVFVVAFGGVEISSFIFQSAKSVAFPIDMSLIGSLIRCQTASAK